MSEEEPDSQELSPEEQTSTTDYAVLLRQAQAESLVDPSAAQTERTTARRPLYFAGGVGYDNERNEGVAAQLNELGYETVAALPNPEITSEDKGFKVTIGDETLDISRREAYRVAHQPEVTDSISNLQSRRADELIAMLEHEGHDKVDAVFQSADALYGLLAMSRRPDLFENVVFAYPAGLVRQPSIIQSAPGVVAAELMVRGKPRHRLASWRDNFEGRGHRPEGTGGFTTVSSVGLSQHNNLLHQVRQGENAPKIAVVVGTDDVMISPEGFFNGAISSGDVDLVRVTNTTHGINGRSEVLKEDVLGSLERLRAIDTAGFDPRPIVDRMEFSGKVSKKRKTRILDAAIRLDERSKPAINGE